MLKSKSCLASLLDTNVWVALAWEGHAFHVAAKKWFSGIPEGEACFCRITQMSFLRLITQNKVMGDDVLTHDEAWEIFDGLTSDGRVQFLGEVASPDETWKRF